MRHGRKLLVCTGVLAIAGALGYVARPAGHVPLYDANLVRLAETNLQGYCAGEAFWRSGGYGDPTMAAACRSRLADQRPNVLDIGAVPRAFCEAVVTEGWAAEGGTVPLCLQILTQGKLWPTYDGSLSDQWNRARPYPAKPISAGGNQGDRPAGREEAPQRTDRPERTYEEGVG